VRLSAGHDACARLLPAATANLTAALADCSGLGKPYLEDQVCKDCTLPERNYNSNFGAAAPTCVHCGNAGQPGCQTGPPCNNPTRAYLTPLYECDVCPVLGFTYSLNGSVNNATCIECGTLGGAACMSSAGALCRG